MKAYKGYAIGEMQRILERHMLTEGDPVGVGEWQSVRGSKAGPFAETVELQSVSIEIKIPDTKGWLQTALKPNLPWAEDHFQERVSGQPLNPPPSHTSWPFAQASNAEHVDEAGKFSHTYPERFWPRFANVEGTTPEGRQIFVPHIGIRYEYGELWDIVNLLRKSIHTRQAFLPVWFPEDTGVVHGERVPCTLGYHFMVRRSKLHLTYYMRSCDLLRYFADDLYMACRLAQWMLQQLVLFDAPGLDSLQLGNITMHVASLHVFMNDLETLRKEHA